MNRWGRFGGCDGGWWTEVMTVSVKVFSLRWNRFHIRDGVHVGALAGTKRGLGH